jgi:RNA polymerase sigma-70 factor (ECF subfamily)
VAAARRARLALHVAEERREGGAVPSPESALLDDERRRALLDAVEALGERDRSVIACRYLLELSEAETAAALGVRPGTVKSRLSRALERLRTSLEARRE